MAYVKRDLFCTRRRDIEPPGVEIMWLDFKFNSSQPFTHCGMLSTPK